MLGLPQVDLNHLTEEERDIILGVLKRDEELQQRDQDRINVLKNEIRQIKLKGTLKPGDGDADKTCSRCRKPFGWIFDKGEICPKCKHKVCETCKVPLEKDGIKWNCVLCQKQRELDAMSGQWFYSKFRKSKRSRKNNRVITDGAESSADTASTLTGGEMEDGQAIKEDETGVGQAGGEPNTQANTLTSDAPYLAREGARNSLERQRHVEAQSTDSLHSPQPGSLSSVAMTDAGRTASVESVTSFYSDAGEGNYGKIPVTGEIQFGLDYNYKTGTFEVRIKQCKDIACVDTKKKRSDPSIADSPKKELQKSNTLNAANMNLYVKTYLLPDRTKSGKRKTRVKKHTTSPVFNEVLKYHMGKSELETRTLWVTVWHNDTFGRNDFLGEVTIPLDYYEFKDPNPKWYKLQERNPTPMSLLTYKGDLSLQLKYVTAEHVSASRKVKVRSGHKGELHVMVKQARNLTAVRANGSSDPFCKAYLMPEKGKTTKQKTPVIKKNCNPQWKHTFVFEDVSGEELRERALELTIWDHDRFTSNDFLGGVRLSLGTGKSYGKEVEWCDSRGEEISLWQGMLDRPNQWIEGTLLLRPNMDSRKKQP